MPSAEAMPMRISTHILDTVTGSPARDVPVELHRRTDEGWQTLAAGRTDADGRLRFDPAAAAGDYQLCFAVGSYLGEDGFFPEVTVAFRVRDPQRHLHVPLLLSRFGYTTYRGS